MRQLGVAVPGNISDVELASDLPSSTSILQLLFAMTSHSSTGIIKHWMSGHSSLETPRGRLRLLTIVAYILLNTSNDSSSFGPASLTWQDIEFLQTIRDELRELGADGSNLLYLVSILLEDAIRNNLSLKFRLQNLLDFSDQITIKGWMDGGRGSVGVHSEELRQWFKTTCFERGLVLPNLLAKMTSVAQDMSAPRVAKLKKSDVHSMTTPPKSNDTFSYSVKFPVFGAYTDLSCPSAPVVDKPHTPKRLKQTPQCKNDGDMANFREIIVVDIQTDHALRRHINKATEIRRDCVDDQSFVQELRKYILKRIHFETDDTKGAVLELAKTNEGFVHIGTVKTGAHSRHFAILFKTLCDVCGVYCRLVRDTNDTYYNVVLISDLAVSGVDEGSRRDPSRTASRTSNSSDDDIDESDMDATPEELIAVFWEPSSVGPRDKQSRLTHPLDKLLQQCNASADAVDLDDFFTFENVLGKGSFGEVWKVDLKRNGRRTANDSSSARPLLIPGQIGSGPFALKIIPPEEADKEEASFMRVYGHSQIVSVIAVFKGYQVLENRKREMEKKPSMCILMQLADQCLETVLTGEAGIDKENSSSSGKSNKPIDLRFAFRVLMDSARAMAYLHSPLGQRPHLVHRDLKPGNILIAKDLRAMVTDFGVARMNPSLETNLTVGAGTEGYMAPEQKTLQYDRPADVYSFGVIIARVLGVQRWKEAPYLASDDFEAMGADPFLSELCMKCIQLSPIHRPSFNQIHQVLLCEFLEREFSRTILNSNSRAKQNSTGALCNNDDASSNKRSARQISKTVPASSADNSKRKALLPQKRQSRSKYLSVMPKSLSLFGRYIRNKPKYARATFRKYQVTKLIPNKAMGHVPSASSQMALWHNDDFNAFWRVSAFNTIYRKRTKPHAVSKDFKSGLLNTVVRNMRVTPSAMYAMDDKGGFDEYVLKSSPEEMRSNMGEKLRSLMYYYMDHPHIKQWSLPYQVLLRKRDRLDPFYARYRFSLKKAFMASALKRSHSHFSPYFLPKSPASIYAQRDKFVDGKQVPKLDLWWNQSPELEKQFRGRLAEAKSFDEAHPDHRVVGSYRKGQGAGGGGKSGGNPRPRSKVYKNRISRSY